MRGSHVAVQRRGGVLFVAASPDGGGVKYRRCHLLVVNFLQLNAVRLELTTDDFGGSKQKQNCILTVRKRTTSRLCDRTGSYSKPEVEL